jgi:hypothetical protein
MFFTIVRLALCFIIRLLLLARAEASKVDGDINMLPFNYKW